MGATNGRYFGMQMKSLDARIKALSPLHQKLLAYRLKSRDVANRPSNSADARSAPGHESRTQLVAYYSLKGGMIEGENVERRPISSPAMLVDGIDEAELTSLVKNALPDFMCPARWVALNSLPRLPNGKLAPALLPDPPKERSAADTDAQDGRKNGNFSILAKLLGDLLGIADIRVDDNFFELGGDSITAMQFVSKAREAGIMIDVASVTAKPTIAALAAEVSEPDVARDEVVSAHGVTPLTPIQSWFFSMEHRKPEQWNLGGALYFNQPLDAQILREAIFLVVIRHPALGSSFRYVNGQWLASIPQSPPPEQLVRFDSSDCEPDAESLQLQVQQLQQEFVLQEGWLIRFHISETENTRAGRLAWVAHHLIIDAISINQFFSEVASCYKDLQVGHSPPVQSLGSVSVREWALRLETLANELRESNAQLPTDLLNESSIAARATEENSSTQVIELAEETTQILLRSSSIFNTGTHELILCALGMTLCELAGIEQVSIDVEHHGRDVLGHEIESGQSIGWFTSFFPFRFIRQVSSDWRMPLRWTKESLRTSHTEQRLHLLEKTAPGRDSGNNSQPQEPEYWPTHPHFEIPTVLFNFQGSQDIIQTDESNELWSFKPEQWDFLRSADNYRSHELEINAWVAERKLRISFHYAHRSADADLISAITQALQKNLLEITGSSTQGQSIAYTPSDFPDADMNQGELDDFINSLN